METASQAGDSIFYKSLSAGDHNGARPFTEEPAILVLENVFEYPPSEHKTNFTIYYRERFKNFQPVHLFHNLRANSPDSSFLRPLSQATFSV
jgi:hypothetical protein